MRRILVLTVAVLLAGLAGWVFRGLAVPQAPPARPVASAPPAPPVVAAPPQTAPTASTTPTEPTEPTPAASPAPGGLASRPPGEPSPRATASLLETLRSGEEPDRYQGLLDARPGEVPPELLRQLLENDASDRVRLAALEIVMESLAGHDDALRALLDEARLVPNAALQEEAERQLAELEARVRRGQAHPPQSDQP